VLGERSEAVRMGILSDVLRRLLRGRDDGLRARLRRWLRGAPSSAPEEPTSRPAPPVQVPPGFTLAARLGEVPPGTVIEVVADGRVLALCNVGGTVHAVSGICPHAGGPLADGTLDGATLTCPLHGWSYDVRDGRCFVDASTRLPTWDVAVVGDAVCVRVAGPG
jgi:nitrite reductase/ring-hydroxylating ferredoxin subunit